MLCTAALLSRSFTFITGNRDTSKSMDKAAEKLTSEQSSHRGEILVIGAGELGANVVAALSQGDDAPAVTVLLRPSDTARHAQLRDEFKARGVEIAEADVATATVDAIPSLPWRRRWNWSDAACTIGWLPVWRRTGKMP